LLDRTIACQEGGIRIHAPALKMTSHELVSISRIPMEALALTHSCHTGCLACGRCRGCQRRFTIFEGLGLEAPSTPFR
jgi:7-cyano-7-deazaguanine synthase